MSNGISRCCGSSAPARKPARPALPVLAHAPFDSQKINAGDQTAYAFTVTKNEGMATIKGRLNQRIGLNQYLDEAEVVIRLKLDTPSSNRTVTVGVSGSTLTKTVTVGADWTTVRIPLKDLLSGDTRRA